MYKTYIHPGTIKQGYLTKSPPLEKRSLKNWKKRWCIFSRANGEEPCLNYYRTEEDAFSSLPIKRVNLKHCFKVEVDLVHSNHKNIFAVHMPNRVYYFSAPSQIEMSDWADILCLHLNLAISSCPAPLPATPPIGNKYGTVEKARANTIAPEGFYASRVVSPECYYNTTRGSPLPAETYYGTRAPMEAHYSPNANAHRPLPKPPDSPLPPLPNQKLSSSPSRSPVPPDPPPRPSPPPPPVPSHSLSHPLPLSPGHPSATAASARTLASRSSPLHHLSPTHATPPVPSHSSHLSSPTHVTGPPVPTRSSPLLPTHHQSHMPPPPLPLPRPHSPSAPSDMSPASRQPNSAPLSRRGVNVIIGERPPAPPPKTPLEDDSSPAGLEEDWGDLEDAPPTPPLPHREKTPLSPASDSTSPENSDVEEVEREERLGVEALPPPVPPRPQSST